MCLLTHFCRYTSHEKASPPASVSRLLRGCTARERASHEAAPRAAAMASAAPAGAPSEVEEAVPPTETLAEGLARGPFTLALSSSFFGFYAHAGALQVRGSRRATRARRATRGVPRDTGFVWAAL